MKIIKLDRSVIPACDVSNIEKLKQLIKETCDIDGIGGYKIGFQLILPYGLNNVVETIREITDLPIIYDHQKAATDIPALGSRFMSLCKKVDAVILFPQAGPITEEYWIKAALDQDIGVIIGGEMTHECYLNGDGGFIVDDAPKRIFEIAIKLGINNFVVPGNKPEKMKEYKDFIESFNIKPIFYSPGLIAQGGSLTEAAKIVERWHAIIGRAIYQAKDIHKAAKEFVRAL